MSTNEDKYGSHDYRTAAEKYNQRQDDLCQQNVDFQKAVNQADVRPANDQTSSSTSSPLEKGGALKGESVPAGTKKKVTAFDWLIALVACGLVFAWLNRLGLEPIGAGIVAAIAGYLTGALWRFALGLAVGVGGLGIAGLILIDGSSERSATAPQKGETSQAIEAKSENAGSTAEENNHSDYPASLRNMYSLSTVKGFPSRYQRWDKFNNAKFADVGSRLVPFTEIVRFWSLDGKKHFLEVGGCLLRLDNDRTYPNKVMQWATVIARERGLSLPVLNVALIPMQRIRNGETLEATLCNSEQAALSVNSEDAKALSKSLSGVDIVAQIYAANYSTGVVLSAMVPLGLDKFEFSNGSGDDQVVARLRDLLHK